MPGRGLPSSRVSPTRGRGRTETRTRATCDSVGRRAVADGVGGDGDLGEGVKCFPNETAENNNLCLYT